jgi:DNA polymerase III subunit epsilon
MFSWLNFSGTRHATGHAFAKDTPLDSLPYTVVDTELTSLDSRSNRLLSIGAVGMEGTRIQLAKQFYCLVNPGVSIPHEGILLHKLRPDEVATGIPPAEALAQLEIFLSGTVVVGHFVDIDLKVLSKEVGDANDILQHPAIDTARAQKWIWNHETPTRKHGHDADNLDLVSLAKEYRIDFQEAHHALQDAFVTAQVWQRVVARLQGMNVKTLASVLRIAGI